MTVETTLRKTIYTPDGLTTVFVFGFAILSAGDVKAELDTGSGLVAVTNFTVLPNVDQTNSPGGTITFDANVPVGTLVVFRDVTALQNTKFGIYSRFPSGTIESALDLLTMFAQQLGEENDRSIRLSIADESETDTELPPYVADRFLGWDLAEKKLVNKLLTDIGTAIIGGNPTDLVDNTNLDDSIVAAIDALNLANASTKTTGTDPAQIPLNSDLGNTRTLNSGTAPGNVTLNNALTDKSLWPTISNGTDILHDIDISAGEKLDTASSLRGTLLVNPSVLTKQGDAVWAEGTNLGGVVGGGVILANTFYHFKLIKKDSDGTIDAIIDPLLDGTNVPAGWTAFVYVASWFTDSGANFVPFEQSGDYFNILTRLNTLTTTTPSITGTLIPALPATGLDTIIGVFFADIVKTVSGAQAWIRSENEVNDLPSLSNNDLRASASIAAIEAIYKDVPLNSSGEVRYRVNVSPVDDFNIKMTGFYNPRTGK